MLIFPKATLEEIGVEPQTAFFRIGNAEGKRKIKSLYLIPSEEQEGAFTFSRVGRGSGIALPVILKRGGIDYEAVKHVFTVTIFNYSEGELVVSWRLRLRHPKNPTPANPEAEGGMSLGKKPKHKRTREAQFNV